MAASIQEILPFLVERFDVMGIELQYWMPIFFVLVGVAVGVSAWLERRSRFYDDANS